MKLPTPNLDDRKFEQLVEEAIAVVRRTSDDWTDLSPGDPGRVLIEVFAHLTELMIYRINRLPDKAYIALLELLGVTPFPPSAAQARLQFELDEPAERDLLLEAGTQVQTQSGADGARPAIFTTVSTVTIPAGATSVEVLAGHATSIVGEKVGTGTGGADQKVQLRNAPILAADLPGKDLVVAVAAPSGATALEDMTLEHGGQPYLIWREVPEFDFAMEGQRVFTVNRYSGEISFAPAIQTTQADQQRPLALVPPADADIRVWYRIEGLGDGRVAAGALNTLVVPVSGLRVRNPRPSTSGRVAESLENAIARGPIELRAVDRAITAGDFELLCERASPGVNRVRAAADAAHWAHGRAGTVNLTVVPVAQNSDGTISKRDIELAQSPDILAQVQQTVSAAKPLGTHCTALWARYKTVGISADVTVYPDQDAASIRSKVAERLNAMITPLRDAETGVLGWPFGRSMLAWDVLRTIGELPGVAGVSDIAMNVDFAPDENIITLSADAYQRNTWYTAQGPNFLQTGNNGESWENTHDFGDETVKIVKAYERTSGDDKVRAGLVAAVTERGDQHYIYLSKDAGQTFQRITQCNFETLQVAWIFRDRSPSLLVGAPTGLFEVNMTPEASPKQVLVNAEMPEMGISDIAVSVDLQGSSIVAVAGASEEGVFLSTEAGSAGSFSHVGLKGELVRVLEPQHTTTRRYLWAGVSAVGNQGGNGCFRIPLDARGVDPDDWQQYGEGWNAGGCRALTISDGVVYAGSLRRGVLCLDSDVVGTPWRKPDVSCGLPLRDVSRLQPVNALAASPGIVLAVGPNGVFCSEDKGISYSNRSRRRLVDEVKLPHDWLFCAGKHDIRVRSGYEES